MDIVEITIPSPDFPRGHTFGPVKLEDVELEETIDRNDELLVTFIPQRCRLFGIDWYQQECRTRGIFSVTANRITLRPTAPIQIERAVWWRRSGYWLFAGSSRNRHITEDSGRHMSRP